MHFLLAFHVYCFKIAANLNHFWAKIGLNFESGIWPQETFCPQNVIPVRMFKQMTPKWALCPDANALLVAFVLQGARVWLRHKEQLLPSTVSACDDSSLVLTTDYGKVSKRTAVFHHAGPLILPLTQHPRAGTQTSWFKSTWFFNLFFYKSLKVWRQSRHFCSPVAHNNRLRHFFI